MIKPDKKITNSHTHCVWKNNPVERKSAIILKSQDTNREIHRMRNGHFFPI